MEEYTDIQKPYSYKDIVYNKKTVGRIYVFEPRPGFVYDNKMVRRKK
jgi:hypothetical protein